MLLSKIKTALCSVTPVPLILLHVLFLIIFVANFVPGHFLIGWDALNPEFNIPLNLQRGVFSAWQDNYGVGTLTGHGFGATLPHTIIVGALSLLLPLSAVRYVFIMLCLYVGILGSFFLGRFLLQYLKLSENKKIVDWLALSGALLYLVNLGTVQIFYLPLEAFTVHFAALPWLILSLIKLLEKRNKQSFFWFFIVNVFASIQAFIPSIFLAYLMAIGAFLVGFIAFHKEDLVGKLKLSAAVVGVILLANAYWLMSFGYYVLNQNEGFLTSYNNLLSTPQFVAKTQKYGDFTNVALLKSFFLENEKSESLLFKPWLDHFSFFKLEVIGYSFFVIILAGICTSLLKVKHWLVRSLFLFFLVFYINLSQSIVPFSWILQLIYGLSPTYEQAFRTSFTKFGVGLAFSYSIFFLFGLAFIHRVSKKLFEAVIIQRILTVLPILLLLFYGLPHLTGNTFFQGLQLELPKPYLQVIEYFKTQPTGRVATLPQDCAEGWYSYGWQYFGSGFYWYAVPQSFMSRSFDVWNNSNEQFYWEFTNALRAENFTQAENILKKYDVSWVIYDQDQLHCQSQDALRYSQNFFEYLKSSPTFVAEKVFTQDSPNKQIIIFTKKEPNSDEFISVSPNIPAVVPTSNWSTFDAAYGTLGNYRETKKSEQGYIFPFTALFTNRSPAERSFTVTESDSNITITQPVKMQNGSFTSAPFNKLENEIFVRLSLLPTSEPNEYQVEVTYDFPDVKVDDKVTSIDKKMNIGTVEIQDLESTLVAVNRYTSTKVDNTHYLDTFTTQDNNEVLILNKENEALFEWFSNQEPEHEKTITQSFVIPVDRPSKEVSIVIPKIADYSLYGLKIDENLNGNVPVTCKPSLVKQINQNRYEINQGGERDYLRMLATNSEQCLAYFFNTLNPSFSYLVSATSRNQTGQPLLLEVIDNSRSTLHLGSLSNFKSFGTDYFIIPATNEKVTGYNITLKNISQNFSETSNDFAELGVWYIPLRFMETLSFTPTTQTYIFQPFVYTSSKRISPTHYTVSFQANVMDSVILQQSFNKGWIAIDNNFKVLTHYKINGWANGWEVHPDTSSVTILFWPEFLTQIGIALTLISLIFFTSSMLRKSKLHVT